MRCSGRILAALWLLLLVPAALSAETDDTAAEASSISTPADLEVGGSGPPATGGRQSTVLVAERITATGPAGWSLGGPDRDAGIGDWALGNGTICAAVSDPAHEGMLYPSGGVLIDVAHCGRDDDQWTTLETMWNLSRDTTLVMRDIEAGREGDRAFVRTQGERDGVRVEIHYEVGLAEPRILHVRMRAERFADGPRFSSLSLMTLHPTGQTRPFVAFRAAPEKSSGFSYPASDPTSTLSLLRALIPADLHVFVGTAAAPELAYGFELVRAERIHADAATPIGMMATTGVNSSVIGVFVDDFWLGEGNPPGLLELAQTLFMDLPMGDRLEVDWRLHLTERADVASVTDRLWREHPRLRGAVGDSEARIHIERPDGTPVTEVRVDGDGRFSVRLPPGAYRVRVRTPAREDVLSDVTVRAGEGAELPEKALAPTSRLELPVGKRMRLSFEGVRGTINPTFGDDLLGFQVGEERIPSTLESHHVHLAGTPDDPRSVRLAPGRYRVTATRGPEHAIEQAEIELAAGETRRLALPEPYRVLRTPGWVSADLHVHSGHSFDTAWPIERQIAALAAEGAEVVVATEHDRVVDPGPVIAALGLAGDIVGVPGVEITSVAETEDVPGTLGHLNAFPLSPTQAYRGGAPKAEGRRLRDVLAETRARGALAQINHPRSTKGRAPRGAFFSHLGVPDRPFDPAAPLAAEPNRSLLEADPTSGLRDLDFDAIEGLNGSFTRAYPLVRADWFSLLRQGERRTMTASSDSHRASSLVALPRTYVRLEDDAIGSFDRDAFVAALREGRAYGTTGPLLDVRLGDAEIGDTFAGRSGILSIEVTAAHWVSVDEARVYVDGALVARTPIGPRDRLEMPLRFARDGFVTVEVSGEVTPPYASVAPDFSPFAFTNPIYVDADGDGRWTPPGLDAPLPPTITNPGCVP